MKKIKLTQGKFALVDDDIFEYLNQWKWYYSKGYACRTQRYGLRKENKHLTIAMHRIIMNVVEGKVIDHINRDTLDNRKENLRIGSQQQNTFNSRKSLNNTSGYKGVFEMKSGYKRNKPWMAQIMFNRKSIFIGYFLNKKQAALAYNQKAKELFGEFSRLNKI